MDKNSINIRHLNKVKVISFKLIDKLTTLGLIITCWSIDVSRGDLLSYLRDRSEMTDF